MIPIGNSQRLVVIGLFVPFPKLMKKLIKIFLKHLTMKLKLLYKIRFHKKAKLKGDSKLRAIE
jgi:hypothetical protein